MIVATLLLATLTPQPQGFTAEEQGAVVATMACLRRYVDAVPRRERRQRGKALIEGAFAGCGAEQAALRSLLRRRFSEQATEEALSIVRADSRDGMRSYIRR